MALERATGGESSIGAGSDRNVSRESSMTDKLKSTLSITRRYVEWYEPKDVSEAHDRDLLLQDIDLLIGRRDG